MGGIALTLAGIAFVVLGKGEATPRGPTAGASRQGRGLALALVAALGQAGGLVLGKLGAGSIVPPPSADALGAAKAATHAALAMDPFAGTQVRVIAGILGFAAVITASGRWRGVGSGLKDLKAVASLTTGAFFGPFLGVSLSLLAVQSGKVGIASAIMSIVPVLIIAPSAIFFKEKVTLREIAGSAVAVGGVFALFLA